MKKIIGYLLNGSTAILLFVSSSFAVYPPSTVFEEEANLSVASDPNTNRTDEFHCLHAVVRQLEQDERRLIALLEALEKQQQMLNRQLTQTYAPPNNVRQTKGQ